MSLSHINENGEANMVDTSGKEVTARIATASGKVTMKAEALNAIASGQTPKGDVLATARLAGIMGAKKTSELIPLCHQIALNKVEIELRIETDGVAILATTKTTDRTGVEMEALTAVSVAGLTLIDMIKAMDPHAAIRDVQVESKSGGKTGDWQR
ncbi:MAG: cyclic pyranopterin monophosphate synthase MoaC [Actinomycetales bacterium]|nr:cyclic pyranopterin monophosphate synthase MoaC [Actinomycetales bacterium]